MPELIPHAPDNPEFARVIELRQLRDLDAFDFDIAPTPAEAEALARLLDAQAVRKLALRRPPDAARRAAAGSSTAELGATVVQTCVVTLDPVTTRIDQPVRRTFLPETAAARPPRSSSTPTRTTRSSRSATASTSASWRSRRWRWRCRPIRASRAPASGRQDAPPPRRERAQALRGAGGAAREDRRRIVKRPGGQCARADWPCANARNRYGPRLVFLSGPVAKGVTSRAASATSRADEWVFRAAARQISRLKHGCSEKQGHARQARHAPVA